MQMRAALNSQPSAPAVSGHREEQSRNTPSGIILVIDDDKDWLAECSFMLETLGLRSIVTSSHEAALAHAANPEISLVIIDYSMPSSDGLTMIHQLSAIAAEGGRQMQFIMATGHASMDIAIGAMRASAADFLQKPVSPDDLKRALQRVNGLNDAASARTALLSKISSLSTELQRLTVLIDDKPASDSAGSAAQSEPEAVSAEFIRALLRNEAKRRKLGGGVLFGDPAWDLLLDLLLAKLEGRTVSVSSACIASGAPTTTALRLINRLIEENILYREQDARDGRRNFLGIHADIEQALTSYLIEQMKL